MTGYLLARPAPSCVAAVGSTGEREAMVIPYEAPAPATPCPPARGGRGGRGRSNLDQLILSGAYRVPCRRASMSRPIRTSSWPGERLLVVGNSKALDDVEIVLGML
jgi:hypothetical protein